jgi:UDP-sulfoquinovose synthase
MRVLILGADGYLGWPTLMHFASKGYDVLGVDDYSRRLIAMQTSSEALIPTPNLDDRAKIYNKNSTNKISVRIGDLKDFRFMESLFIEFKPDTVIHYAEQPSAPYSLRGYDEANYTLTNNLLVTHNLIWAIMKHAPDCHMVKLGTMGEYGTPNIDIEEGWIEIEHKGRKQKFLYPRQAGSLYHTTKVLDTDLLWFYVRTFGLRVTDLMQGPVYGILTPDSSTDDNLLPNFHYDDIFGTVVNRFIVQAVANVPLTVYGKGGQTRGYLNLNDTLQCVELATKNPASKAELKIYNQLTETFTVNQLAEFVKNASEELGIKVVINNIENPRKELEEHYYNPASTGLLELGLSPNFMTNEVLKEMIKKVIKYKSQIDVSKILPRVKWS